MANIDNSDSGDIEQAFLDNLFYYHIWKTRLDWTGHVIPVKALHPSRKFFVEGYINTPPKITDKRQLITVTLALITDLVMDIVEVYITDIYPTSRKLTYTDETGQTKPYIFTENQDRFNPTINFSFSNLNHIFAEYPDRGFTIKELASMLNVPESDFPINMEHKVILKGKGICLIDKELKPTFSGFKRATIEIKETIMSSSSPVYNNFNDIYSAYQNCTNCNLGNSRIKRNAGIPTFGRNNDKLFPNIANKKYILFLGEAPGVQEEQTKIAFHPDAPAGGILNKVITAAGINLDNCYFTNAVLCRPESNTPGSANTAPTKEYIFACNSRLKNEIALINPKVIVILGKSAYTAFFGVETRNILSMTGWLSEPKNTYFVPHPSFIARELSFAIEDNKTSIKTKYLSHFLEVKQRFDAL